MDQLLASIIGGGPATVDVTVNGQPLSSLITQLASSLKDHQDQIAELREYTYRTDEKMWNRITTLEDGVSKINNDLGFPERGDNVATNSTHSRVSNLERDLMTLNNKRKGAACAAALDHANMKLLRERYNTWLSFSRRNHLLRMMFNSNANEIRKRYMRKLAAGVKLIKRRRTQTNSAEVLERFNNNRLMRHYYDHWHRFRELSLNYRAHRQVALIRAVEAMRAVSIRGFMRRKWLQWLGLIARRRLHEDQRKAALRMAAVSSRSLVRRYFSQWLNVEGQHNLRRRQLRTATALAVQSARILAGHAFNKWLQAGRRKKQRRMGAGLIPRMAHEQSVRLAARYYSKMWRFALSNRDRRSRSQLEEMTKDLTRRFETLSGEVAGTRRETEETATALQKLSVQQQQPPSSAAALLRHPTPPGRKPSPPVRSDSAHNLQNLAAGVSPQPAAGGGDSGLSLRPPPAGTSSSAAAPAAGSSKPQQQQPSPHVQTGVSQPSSSAMQLGTHVSQVSLRGGGSGEVTRVARASTSSQGSRSGSNAVGQPQGLPQQWLESPEAAWGSIRDRLQNK